MKYDFRENLLWTAETKELLQSCYIWFAVIDETRKS